MYRLDDLGFIAHPRTASRSTRNILLELGAERHGGHHNIDEAICQNLLQKGGVIACTVRNMWDVCLSWYFNQFFDAQGGPLCDEVPTFENYLLKELIPKPRHRWFQTPIFHYGVTWATHKLRYTHLQEDLNALLRVPCVLPVVGASGGKRPYMEYYSTKMRQAVIDRWSADFYLTKQ